ncbi:DUF4363 family protein [Clostridium sartagoforme]|uniref:DUF4363 family protein n=1 Tax=Clostridium sartagoforme TaxID=84031 RepID=A0A4S2DJ16_9CLOT|nr:MULTISPECIES: DUF4363 family protein [Clostridium]MBS5938692.1 DUF4363 family protein [Clostridium sp.]TGY40921.1 DUF4363 family protein [Clostridium sartagoforme]
MKNTYISIVLFAVLTVALFFLNYKFIDLCDEIVLNCDDIEVSLNDYDEESAYEKAVTLLELITDKADIPAIYLNHVDYDLLKNESLKLSLYIRGDDRAESLATLHALRSTAQHLKELQSPNLKNLL